MRTRICRREFGHSVSDFTFVMVKGPVHNDSDLGIGGIGFPFGMAFGYGGGFCVRRGDLVV